MTTPETTPARKPRQKKWASELARQAHSNQRRKLAKEAAEREVRVLDEARNQLRQAENRLVNIEANKRMNMVANGLGPRLRAVMNSWGLDLPVSLTAAERISAYTDFAKIVVNFDRRLMSREVRKMDDVAPISDETLRQLAAETRALFYHEVGHNLFSVPLPALLTLAWVGGWDPPTTQLNGEILVRIGNPDRVTERENREELAASNRTVVDPAWAINRHFHDAWNILEDQRMEAMLVEESPALAAYLTVLVTRNIIQDVTSPYSWSLVAGRTYLPDSMRAASKARWDRRHDGGSDEIVDVIDRYMVATDPVTMINCVYRLVEILAGATPSNVTMSPQYNRGSKAEAEAGERVERVGRKLGEVKGDEGNDAPVGSENDEADGGGSGQAGGDDEDDDEGAGRGEGSKGSPGPGIGTGPHDPDDKGTNPVRDALNDALQDLDEDETLDEDVAAMNEAHDVDDGSLTSYDVETTLKDEDLTETAQALVDDFIRAYEIATADCSPHWESGQRRGVLEPIRYRTRQPGDLEIFRAYADDGEPGANFAVSIFLDVSGSMGGSTAQLGAAAWASKVACDRIGVACDVTLFDTGGWTLYGANDRADHIPQVNVHGGTNPQAAFDAVLQDERDERHHLVLVMTDGEWEDNTVLRNHRHGNVRTMVFNYRTNDWSAVKGMASNPRMALKLSADEAYDISDLMDIPKALESMLVGLL